MVDKTLTTGEIIYGLLALFYGIPSIEEVLAGEILRVSQGSMQIIFGMMFIILSVLGVYALFDGLCRLLFNKAGIEIIEIIYEWIKEFYDWFQENF